jgi:hypothetical protein
MKLAKASQDEIDTLMRWLQDKEAAKFEDAKNRPPAFMRVVFGYETLVNNVCDPAKDYLDWKPGYAPSDTDRLRAGIEEALMHLETNYCIDGHSMKDSDAARALRRALGQNIGHEPTAPRATENK